MARSLVVPEAGKTLVWQLLRQSSHHIEDDKQESTERENRSAEVIQPSSDGLSEEQKRQFSLLID